MRNHLFILMLIVIFLAACTPQTPVDSNELNLSAPAEEPEESSVMDEPLAEPDPTITAVPPIEEAYPMQPETDDLAGGYPTIVEDVYDPYPGAEEAVAPEPAEEEMIWVIKPMGVQCEESGVQDEKQGLKTAVETLAAASVQAKQWETTELMVTAVCGAPTSTHYRVEIPLRDLSIATSLDWVPE